MINKQRRQCTTCREEIHGRSDKRFCSDYCRALHYNQVDADASLLMRRVNYQIRKNRRILARFNPKGKTKVARANLLEAGLNFQYHTHTRTTRSGQVFRFCYDQGYYEMKNNYVKILAQSQLTEKGL